MTSVAETVIARFGGLNPLARKLGHKHPTTVQGWRESGTIPHAHWPVIERAAAEEGFAEITVAWLAVEHGRQIKRAFEAQQTA